MSDTPRTEAAWDARRKTDWDLAWEVYCCSQQLERELTKALEQRDRAMFYARHRAMECAQMENADCECTCGLTELRNKVKKETK